MVRILPMVCVLICILYSAAEVRGDGHFGIGLPSEIGINRYNKILAAMTKKTAELPRRIGPTVVWTDVRANGSAMEFYYTLDNSRKNTDLNKFRIFTINVLRGQFCQEPTFQEIMKEKGLRRFIYEVLDGRRVVLQIGEKECNCWSFDIRDCQ